MELFDQLLRDLLQRSEVEGVKSTDLLDLPHPLDRALKKLLRAGSMTADALAGELGLSHAETIQLAALLTQKGFLTASEAAGNGGVTYRVRLSRVKGRKLPDAIWQVLGEQAAGELPHDHPRLPGEKGGADEQC